MSSSQKDFEYPLKDINLLKVSLQVLKEDESKARFYASLTGVITYGSCHYLRLFSMKFKTITSLFTSVMIYNMISHQARNNYARLAEICNKNASIRLNTMMQ